MEHRFRMDFGRVLGGFWEVKNLDFRIFFDVVSMLKFERCFESKSLRKKHQTDAGVSHFGPARRNVRGAGGRKREGFRSLLGQNSGKNILGKHFRCSEDRRSNLVEHPARSSPVGRRIFYAPRMPPTPRSWQCSRKFIEKVGFRTSFGRRGASRK